MFAALPYCLVLVQAGFALSLASMSAKPVLFEVSRPITAALLIWTVGCMFLIGKAALAGLRAGTAPGMILSRMRAEIGGGLVLQALRYAVLVGFAMALHGWAKTMIPHVSGYWADPMLAELDAALFGRDPGPLFRTGVLDPFFANLYVCWFPVTFGLVGALAFSRKDHGVLLTTFVALLVLVGTMGQYVAPSVGPIFYERLGLGSRFAAFIAGSDPSAAFLADYLWRNYESGGANLGTGISAMPSMHVTDAVWTVFAARAISRFLFVPALIYATVIYVTSIASGWHYATDGLFGGAAAVFIHVALSRLVRYRDERGKSLSPATA